MDCAGAGCCPSAWRWHAPRDRPVCRAAVLAAEQAVLDWVNSKQNLVGTGNPLSMGAFLRMQASPGDGGYAIVQRLTGSSDLVAEQDSNLCAALIAFSVHSAAEDVAERAAAALASAVEQLTGSPDKCGGPAAPVTIPGAHKLARPGAMPQPPHGGDPDRVDVNAEVTLAAM